MENIEKKAAATLKQQSYTVTLGGKEFEFRPISLSDRYEISAIASQIRVEVNPDEPDGDLLRKAISYGKYGKEIAEIITEGAHIRGSKTEKKKILFWDANVKRSEKERKKEVFEHAFYKASEQEITQCIIHIVEQINPAFFLSTLISLNRQNILTKTKETAPTVLG
jgi:hypothetical protein